MSTGKCFYGIFSSISVRRLSSTQIQEHDLDRTYSTKILQPQSRTIAGYVGIVERLTNDRRSAWRLSWRMEK